MKPNAANQAGESGQPKWQRDIKGFEMTRLGGLRGPVLRSPESLYGENHCLLERLASKDSAR